MTEQVSGSTSPNILPDPIEKPTPRRRGRPRKTEQNAKNESQQPTTMSAASGSLEVGQIANVQQRSLSVASNSSDPNVGDVPKRKSRRQARKTCRICGDKAFSYNFNVITCESCKAFFRRNAFRQHELRCPYENKCVMDKNTRRYCQLCRIKKCFEVGMKPDWIMNEEEKEKRKQMILENKKRRLEDGGINDQRPEGSQDPGQSHENLGMLQPKEERPSMDMEYEPISPIPTSSSSFRSVAAIVDDYRPNIMSTPFNQAPNTQLQILPCKTTSAPNDASFLQQNPDRLQVLASVSAKASSNLSQHGQNPIIHAPQPLYPTSTAMTVPDVRPSNPHELAIALVETAKTLQMDVSTSNLAQSSNLVGMLSSSIQASNMANSTARAEPTIPDFLTLPKDMILKLLATQMEYDKLIEQKRAEEEEKVIRKLQPPPKKCKCKCQCRRYSDKKPLLEQAVKNLLQGSSSDEDDVHKTAINTRRSIDKACLARTDQHICGRNFDRSTPKIIPQTNRLQSSTVQEASSSGTHNVNSIRTCRNSESPIKKDNKTTEKPEDMPPVIPENDLDHLDDPDKLAISPTDQTDIDEVMEANQHWFSALDSKEVQRHSQSNPNHTDLVNMADGAIRRLVKMTKKISSFRNLNQHDQLILLKNTCMEYLILRGAMSYDAKTNAWAGPSLESGYQIKMNAMRDSAMDLFEGSIKFYATFREEWRTNERVMLLLGMIVIFNPQTPDLQDTITIGKHNRRYRIILKRLIYEICHQDLTKTCKEYKSLIGKLDALAPLNAKAIRMIEQAEPSTMEPLVKEMFIPGSNQSSILSS